MKKNLENIISELEKISIKFNLNLITPCEFSMIKRNVNHLQNRFNDLKQTIKSLAQKKERHLLLEELLTVNEELAYLHLVLLQIKQLNTETLYQLQIDYKYKIKDNYDRKDNNTNL